MFPRQIRIEQPCHKFAANINTLYSKIDRTRLFKNSFCLKPDYLRTHSASNLIILSSLSIDLEYSVINDFSNVTHIVVFPLCDQHHNFTFPFTVFPFFFLFLLILLLFFSFLALFPFFLPSSILQFPLHFFLSIFLFSHFLLHSPSSNTFPHLHSFSCFPHVLLHYYQVKQE